MVKKNLKLLIITSIVVLLPIIAGCVLWEELPDKIPTHWNISGEVDGYSSKLFAVVGMPIIMLGVQWLCVLATGTDPKRRNHSDKMRGLVFWVCPITSIVLSLIVYGTALGERISVEVIMPVLVGLLFIILGNYLPKCKQNYTIGYKLPWTLDNEENWNKTHRLAGWLMVIGGVAVVISGFFGVIWVMFPTLGVLSVIPVIYSYVIYKNGKGEENNE